MIGVLKKIWDFAGKEQKNIKKSVFASFLYAIFYMFEMGAIYFVVTALVDKSTDKNYVYLSVAMMMISIIGRIVCKYFSELNQTHAGFYMIKDKRVYIGNRLKSIPMGYFNSNSLGEITGITTTVLDDVENTAPTILVSVLSGFINALVFTLYILVFDYRFGLIVMLGTAIYLYISSTMQKKSEKYAPKRQESEATLVEAVLETIKGMFIVKSFNLSRLDDKKIDKAIEDNEKRNLAMEQLFTPYTIAEDIVLKAFSVLIVLASVVFYLNNTLSLTYCLMMIIVSFLIFEQIASAGSGMAIMRVAGSSIEHSNQIENTPTLDEKGKNINPKKHDIKFQNVSFSYDKRKILDNINLTIKDKSSLAIVGPSGSGKSTLCNLISRFWDVDAGSIKIGGYDVRDYNLESLMKQISMVFQDVYLFNDTIENNIKFGVPNATHQMVVEAARKACCDDFIESLPDGYNTVIGESGSALSGGEKQRISIARAILKDAPIIIFDEATASVDPENEDRLQKAMEKLMEDKTVIMIAHRLKTVRNASNIIVIKDGKIVQQGTHDKLIKEQGIYKNFVSEKKKSAGWKIGQNKECFSSVY